VIDMKAMEEAKAMKERWDKFYHESPTRMIKVKKEGLHISA